tara:strand:- start:209 stop:409 length:201 start_codon:yes stop_codon:yes gene_type:complete
MIKVGDLVRMKKRAEWAKRSLNLGLVLAVGLKSRTVSILEPGEAVKIQWTNGATTVTGISMVEQAQ